MEDSTRSLLNSPNHTQVQDSEESGTSTLSLASGPESQTNAETRHSDLPRFITAQRRLQLSDDESKECVVGWDWENEESLAHHALCARITKRGQSQGPRQWGVDALTFFESLASARPTQDPAEEPAEEPVNDRANRLCLPTMHTSAFNRGGTELGRNHTLVDSGTSHQENGRDSGRNPFRDALLHTIPLWMNDYDVDGAGYVHQEGTTPLYKIGKFAETNAFIGLLDRWMFEMLQYDRDYFYVHLFFQKRFFATRRINHRTHLVSLAMSWDAFARQVAHDPVGFINGFKQRKQDFMKKRLIGTKFFVHSEAIKNSMACAVRENCPFCYSTSHKLPEDLRTIEYLPEELFDAMDSLDSDKETIYPEDLKTDIEDLEETIKRLQIELEEKRDTLCKFFKRHRQNDE